MRALVVHAHPAVDSFSAHLRDVSVRGLVGAGHEVRAVSLYECGFRAVLSPEEHTAYASSNPILDPMVAEHAEALRWAQLLVFVFPTWWAGPPAILKGWLERVLVEGVAFSIDPRSGRLRPELRQVRRVVGVTTYGSPRWYVAAVGNGSRRTILRSLRLSCGWRARGTWLALHRMDTRTDAERRAFAARVEAWMAGL